MLEKGAKLQEALLSDDPFAILDVIDLPPEHKDSANLARKMYKDPNLAIQEFLPEEYKPACELLVKANENPVSVLKDMGVPEEHVDMIEKAQNLNENPEGVFELLDLTDEQKKEIQKAKDAGDDPVAAVEKLLDDDQQKRIAQLRNLQKNPMSIVDIMEDEYKKSYDETLCLSNENMKLLKMGSNLQEDPIGVLEEAGVPEDQVSQLRMAKKLADDPMEALEMAGLPPQQVKALKLAKLFKDDPEAAALA